MKEVIFVLLNGFADWEGAFTAICLNQGVKPGNPINYKVKYLSITKEPVTSIGGLRVLPDYDLKDMPEDYAGLILIGGMRWFSPEACKESTQRQETGCWYLQRLRLSWYAWFFK
jgi:hypothetical protein